ncbi:MAG: UvrB/UvrC motif-containing protein [Bacteroidetes bacterium]|nr:UvrB/UvrC motif-containing protein [Bacteroidota bacterium]
MNPIEPLLAELNELCKNLDSISDNTISRKRIREIFTEFVRQGYNIVTPRFDPESPEYGALSENGKLICERLIYIRKKKLEAIDHENFEFAADLRELERELKKRMVNDFSIMISNKFFVLLTEDSKEIIYNDFDGKLKAYFKIT